MGLNPPEAVTRIAGTSLFNHWSHVSLTYSGDLREKVRIANVLSDHLLDCATVVRVGLHEQNRFSLFHYLLFLTVCAGNWKPIRANRQPLRQKCRLIWLASSAVLSVT